MWFLFIFREISGEQYGAVRVHPEAPSGAMVSTSWAVVRDSMGIRWGFDGETLDIASGKLRVGPWKSPIFRGNYRKLIFQPRWLPGSMWIYWRVRVMESSRNILKYQGTGCGRFSENPGKMGIEQNPTAALHFSRHLPVSWTFLNSVLASNRETVDIDFMTPDWCN